MPTMSRSCCDNVKLACVGFCFDIRSDKESNVSMAVLPAILFEKTTVSRVRIDSLTKANLLDVFEHLHAGYVRVLGVRIVGVLAF